MPPTNHSDLFPIGSLAERTGCSVPTIRYYEKIALIPPAIRRASGHRVYAAASVDQLIFIRRCRDLGFPIDEIKALLALATDQTQDCRNMRDIAANHLEAIRARLRELQTLEASLDQYVRACTATCAGGAAPQCSLLQDLATAKVERTPAAHQRCCG